MGSLSIGSSQTSIGLDIGTGHVRVAQVKSTGSGFVLTGYGSVTVPMGAVADGEIVDTGAVSAAIKDLWRHSKVRGKNVSVGVSNQRVIVRLIDLPFMERGELQSAIQYQAQDYIPMAVEDSILDFQIIGDYMTSADEHMMEVLLVAAHREMIANAVSAVEGAGLKLDQIDVSSFAVVRALMGESDQILPDDEGQATAIIHISSGLTNITVVERGVPRFNRISSLAGSTFTQAIANVLNVGFDEADDLKRRIGLPDISGGAEDAAPGMDPEYVAVVHESIEREANKFIAEVRRSLDYYLTQTSQVRSIQRIFLTGSGSQLRNLAAYLEKGLQAQVLVADPFDGRVQISSGAQQALGADKMGAVTAVGLALGGLRS
ncbi:MAG: type IV pilus assembly protein PilM [Coriobacteriia bacterium]|nr:type IV pilus assembly protein PilM [Coriobacteriia bacterium]